MVVRRDEKPPSAVATLAVPGRTVERDDAEPLPTPPRPAPSNVETMLAPPNPQGPTGTIAAPARGGPVGPTVAKPLSEMDTAFADAAKKAREAVDARRPLVDSERATMGFGPDPRRESADEQDRALVLASVEKALLGTSDEPVRIGRFVLIKRLGRGAMGVVYLAYDPKLDRKVAIKVVDASQLGTLADEAQHRLEREAQATATLQHPNVVTVFDVGKHDGQVFLAMEFVEGRTLTDWLAENRPSWRATVEMFIQIGRGLAAAHGAGLVHRDFKPDNVLVGNDGRPRVADFGLARPTDGWTARDANRILAEGTVPPQLRSHDELATTGEIAGTPAYMAPEQYVGINVASHSDQYAFCVALFEALYGQRPFNGETITDLATKVIEGRLDTPPSTVHVPGTLMAAIRKGLSLDPVDRYPSVDVLVDRLERILHARRRRIVWGIASFLTVSGLGAGYQVAVATQPELCEDMSAALGDAWSDERKSAMRDAFATSGADTLFGALAADFDTYAAAWVQKREEICEAHRVRGDQTEAEMALRNACLDRAQSRFDGLTSELASGGELVGLTARGVDSLLPNLDHCDQLDLLTRFEGGLVKSSMRDDAAADDAWYEAGSLVTRANLREVLGRDGWPEMAQSALQIASEHDLPDVKANALRLLGIHEQRQGNLEASDKLLLDGLDAAITRGAADKEAAHLVYLLIHNAGLRGDTQTARLHLGYLERFIERAAQRSEHEEFVQLFRGRVMIVEGQIASIEGRNEDAKASLMAAIEHLEKTVGRDDPDTVWARDELAGAHKELGEVDAALALKRENLEISIAKLGPEHDLIAKQRMDLGIFLHLEGRNEDASVELETAYRIAKGLYGEEHPLVGQILGNWGLVLRHMGQLEKSRELQEKSLGIRAATLGEKHPEMAFALMELGLLEAEAGKRAEALGYLNRAGQTIAESLGGDHPLISEALTRVGRVLLMFDDPQPATGALSQALAIRTANKVDPVDMAETQFLMAKAQHGIGDHEKAREAASAAIESLRSVGRRGDAERAKVETWLGENLPAPAPN